MLVRGCLDRRKGDRRVGQVVALPGPVEDLVCGGPLRCGRRGRRLSGVFFWRRRRRPRSHVAGILHVRLVADGAVRRPGLCRDLVEPQRRQGVQRPLRGSAVAGVRVRHRCVERLHDVVDDGGDVRPLPAALLPSGPRAALDGAGNRVAKRRELDRPCSRRPASVRLRGAAAPAQQVVQREREDPAGNAVVAQRVVDSLAAHCCVLPVMATFLRPSRPLCLLLRLNRGLFTRP